jgi:hypothetical protein
MSVCDISGSGCLVCFNKVLRLLCTIETEIFSASRRLVMLTLMVSMVLMVLRTLLSLANGFDSTLLSALMVLMVLMVDGTHVDD